MSRESEWVKFVLHDEFRFCRSKEIRKSRDGTERNAYFARS